MTDKSATLKLGDKTVDLSVRAGTIGPDVIDGYVYLRSGLYVHGILRIQDHLYRR